MASILIACLVLLPLTAGTGSAKYALVARSSPRNLIVKFKATGPSALENCAETLQSQATPFADYLTDRSGSIDRLHAQLGVKKIRALFRRPDGRSFQAQRMEMRHRFDERVRRRAAAGSGRIAAPRRRPSELPDLSHVYRVEIEATRNLHEAVTAYRADPHVEWAQLDHTHQLDALPNDPFLRTVGSWGQDFEDLWGVHRINAPEAWQTTQGEGVVVAVVDTGLDYAHPDIAANVWINSGEDLNGNGRVDASDWNGIDDDANGWVDDLRGYDFAGSAAVPDVGEPGDPDPFDVHGHGTHVAGTIAAIADNGIGIAGVAPAVKLMPLKGFDDAARGVDSVLWRAVLYAAEMGASVINNSWSCAPLCPENPLAEEVLELVHALDVVVVTSAGNGLADVVGNSPEKLDSVITVASTGVDDQPSPSFSNTGWLVDVGAPGGGPTGDRRIPIGRRNILSLRSSADESAEFASVGEDYYRSAGTSMAAPHVSGVAALLRAARPDLSWRDIRRIIRLSAVDLGRPGHDEELGPGRVDAAAALTRAELPALEASIDFPIQGDVVGLESDVIEILGNAFGSDLAEYRLSYGIGRRVEEWIPIGVPQSHQVVDGELGVWHIADLDPGEYVVRLEVAAVDGTVYREFLVLSIERHRFFQISASGLDARAPSLSYGRVVWESRRSREDAFEDSGSTNIFASTLGSDQTDLPISTRDADESFASISGRLISWSAEGDEPGSFDLLACILNSRTGACPEFPVLLDQPTRIRPVVAAGRVFWLEGTPGALLIRGCQPDPVAGRCLNGDLVLPPSPIRFFSGHGDVLTWVEPEGAVSRIVRCVVHRDTGQCEPASFVTSGSVATTPSASERLIAWQQFSPFLGLALFVCELDDRTGECPEVLVLKTQTDVQPKVSLNRVVWTDKVEDHNRDVFFCEYDRLLEQCPVQHLTAELSNQQAATIGAHEIVWQDTRTGASQIFGIELPGLHRLSNRRVKEGGLLFVHVRTRGRDRSTYRLGATVREASSLEELGARFFDLGRGRGVLLWRTCSDCAGLYTFTFSAKALYGPVTRQSIRVEVLERRRRHLWSQRGARWH